MRNMIVVAVVLMTLSGCGFVFQNYKEGGHEALTYGMPKEEVVRKIGQPQKISTMVIDDKKYEVWEYPNDATKTKKINALGTDYSKVFFLDGKVVQRDKDMVYAQPSYEFLETIDPGSRVKSAQ